MDELEKSCYDKFDIRLEALQVLIAQPGKLTVCTLLKTALSYRIITNV